MKNILFILLLTSTLTFAQKDTLTLEDLTNEFLQLKTTIQNLQNENASLKSLFCSMDIKIINAYRSIDSLRLLNQENTNAFSQTIKELDAKISVTEMNANQKITELDNSLSRNSLYEIFAIFCFLVLSVTIYWILTKRQRLDKTVMIEQLNKTKTSIEESIIKELIKQTELLENQIKNIEDQKSFNTNINQEPDHSLILKMANEINTMERNLSFMDTNIKGYKQLKRSVEKLKDYLNANGYEILDLLGKNYHHGLPVIIVNSYPDETIQKDAEIISKILIPAVRYKDKIIQTAQIEVNVGV